MPEVKLGSSENMKNINLGDIEIQEAYLGAVLVWQNNLGPIIEQIAFNGMVVNADDEGILDGDGAVFAGVYNGATLNYSFSFNDILDPDYAQQVLDGVPVDERDYVVGYRIQRPDDTWYTGDPDSTFIDPTTNLPEGEFGTSVNTTLRYNSVTELFDVNGEVPDGTLDLAFPVVFRDVDEDSNAVDAVDVPFLDKGIWKFFMVDSRGGQTEMAHIDITLSYQAPSASGLGGAANGLSIGNVGAVSYTTTGGPHTAQWGSSTSPSGPFTGSLGTGTSLNITASAFNAPVYYSPLLTGRLSEENATRDTSQPTGIARTYDTYSVQNRTISVGTESFSDVVTTPCTGAAGPSECEPCTAMTCPGTSGTVIFNRINRTRTDIQGLRCTNDNGGAIVADSFCPAYVKGDAPVMIALADQNGLSSTCNGPNTNNGNYVDCSGVEAVATGISSGATLKFGGATSLTTTTTVSTSYPAQTCCFKVRNALYDATCGSNCSGCRSAQIIAKNDGTSSDTVTGFAIMFQDHPVIGVYSCDNKFNGGLPCTNPVGTPCSHSFVGYE